jgi:hypothetical protein
MRLQKIGMLQRALASAQQVNFNQVNPGIVQPFPLFPVGLYAWAAFVDRGEDLDGGDELVVFPVPDFNDGDAYFHRLDGRQNDSLRCEQMRMISVRHIRLTYRIRPVKNFHVGIHDANVYLRRSIFDCVIAEMNNVGIGQLGRQLHCNQIGEAVMNIREKMSFEIRVHSRKWGWHGGIVFPKVGNSL